MPDCKLLTSNSIKKKWKESNLLRNLSGEFFDMYYLKISDSSEEKLKK